MNRISFFYRASLPAFVLFAFLTFPGLSRGQNQMPVVSNVTATVNNPANEVNITFDATDSEGDNLDIWIQVSADSGKTWRVPVDSISGNAGFPQTPGNNLSLTWHYDPVALANWLGSSGGMMGFRIRVIADDRIPIDIADLVAQVDSARIIDNLRFISGIRHRTAGFAHLMEVRDSLKQLMDDFGLYPWHDAWDYSGYNAENIIGRHAGLKNEEKTVLISGHYDSVNNTPGVDDNGSAVVGVMEAMYVMGNYFSENSTRYIFWDLEESGLLGSRRWTGTEMPVWEQSSGLLNMETMAYYSDQPGTQNIPFGFDVLFPAVADSVRADSNRGNFLTNVANTGSSWLKSKFDSLAAVHVPELRVLSLETQGAGLLTPDLLRSDHAPFWASGLPALMLTDGADFRNPNYHTNGDSLGTINFQFLYRNIKAVIACWADIMKPMHADAGESQDFQLSIPTGFYESPAVSDVIIAPNPGEEDFTFRVVLDKSAELEIDVFDLQGKKLDHIATGEFPAGTHDWKWHANDNGNYLPQGLYLLRVVANNKVVTKRILVGEFEHRH